MAKSNVSAFIKDEKMTTALIAVGSGIAANLVTKYVPIEDEKIRAVVPGAIGFFLLDQDKPELQIGGIGMLAASGSYVGRAFGIGELDDDIMGIDDIEFEAVSDDVSETIAGDDDDEF